LKEWKAKFYIAHRITNRHYIRDTVCPKLQKAGYFTVNPFYTLSGKPRKIRWEIAAIDQGSINPYKIVKDFKRSKEIVGYDLSKIVNADGLVCFMNEASIGASMEIFFCAHVLGKPIYIVTEKYSSHPWLIYYTTITKGFIVPSLNKLIKELNKIYEDK